MGICLIKEVTILSKTLRLRLFLTYVLSMLLVISLLSGILYIQTRQNLSETIRQNSIAQSKLYANQISLVINTHLSHLQTLANSDPGRSLNHDIIFERFHDMIDNKNLFVFTGAIFYPDGTIYDINGTTNNITDRKYFKDLFNSDVEFIISEPLIGKFRQNRAVVLVVPIIVDDQRVAGLLLPMDLKDISSTLTNVQLTENSYGWIVDETGLLIAHPNEDYIMNLNIFEADDRGFKGLKSLSKKMFETNYGVGGYHDYNTNSEKILSYALIPGTPGWRLGITTPTREIYAPLIHQVFTLIGVSILGLFISILLALGFSSRMTNPLKALTEAVTNLRKGKISTIPDSKSVKEIDTLVSAFNTMSKELNDLSDNLEEKVGQRTQSLKEMNTYLNELATKDHLTKLFNRGFILEKLSDLKVYTDEKGIEYFGILFVDLNNFKYYNDTFGHDVGDELLKLCTDIIKNYFREHDIVARYGGDEFIILLQDINHENFNHVIDSFKKHCDEKLELKTKVASIVSNNDIPEDKLLGFSIGYCYYGTNEARTIERLIQVADQRMYEHKASMKVH